MTAKLLKHLSTQGYLDTLWVYSDPLRPSWQPSIPVSLMPAYWLVKKNATITVKFLSQFL